MGTSQDWGKPERIDPGRSFVSDVSSDTRYGLSFLAGKSISRHSAPHSPRTLKNSVLFDIVSGPFISPQM